MSNGLVSWFGGRTVREQLLLKVAAFVILGGGFLLFAYQRASSYRESAATDLSGALQMRDDIARLKSLEGVAAAPVPTNDGSVRGIVSVTASQFGLSPTRMEPDGPTGLRTTFEPTNAQNVYRWVDAVERAGLVVSRISLVRAGEGDVVEAGATIASR